MTAPRTELDPHIFGEGQPCFGCRPDHPFGFRLRFAREGDEIVTTFTPGELHQGPPGIMHGGLVTTLADELAAWTLVGLRERFGFTAALEGRLARAVRVGTPIVGRGRITNETSRVAEIETRLEQNGLSCFQGKFKFVLLDRAGAERLLGGPLPEGWARFAR